jgi:hypothetical protein
MRKKRSYEANYYPIASCWLLARLTMLMAMYGSIMPVSAGANPYLAKPGEATATVHVATCAVSGGFIHLYTAMDNG